MSVLELMCVTFNPHRCSMANSLDLNLGGLSEVVGLVGVGLFGLEVWVWVATSASFERKLLSSYMGGFFFASSTPLTWTLGGWRHLVSFSHYPSTRFQLTNLAVLVATQLHSSAARLNSQSHREVYFEVAGFSSTYTDSGLWDTFLLVSFDRVYRSVLVYTILPLSEHNVIEKMSFKVLGELVQNKVFSFFKKNFTLSHILYNIVYAITVTFVLTAYLIMCATW
jgi:hypothetical protein